MSFLTLAYVAQIALFGAAGTMFIQSFFRMQARRRARGETGNPAHVWRLWRHPHLRAARTQADRAEDRRIAGQMLWGIAFLGAALGLQAWTLASSVAHVS